jgi:hypothetical protein
MRARVRIAQSQHSDKLVNGDRVGTVAAWLPDYLVATLPKHPACARIPHTTPTTALAMWPLVVHVTGNDTEWLERDAVSFLFRYFGFVTLYFQLRLSTSTQQVTSGPFVPSI